MSLREQKKQDTERKIVAAAERLFRSEGFDATRTADIARAAGIATGTLFNYAPTKRAVLVLVWKRRVAVLADASIAAGQAATNPLDAVEAIFRPLFSFYMEDPALGRLFLQSVMFDTDLDEDLRQLNQGFVAQLAMLFAPYTRNPATTGLNVFGAYFTVLTMLLGGQLPDVGSAVQLLRTLVAAARDGWGR